MGLAARARAEERFSQKRMAEKYEEIYLSILRRKPLVHGSAAPRGRGSKDDQLI
jgi:hypothetical protein